MLSIGSLTSSAQAVSYYKGAKGSDYYIKGQGGGGGEGIGPDGVGDGAGGAGGDPGVPLRESQWFGEGAKALGLEGEVEQQVFQGILDGQVPGGPLLGKIETGPEGALVREHVPGLDLTFSAPKSVSVLALVKGDPDVIRAHDDAVKTALSFIEKRVLETRQSFDGVVSATTGQDMVAALFREESSRELDPQLHTHAVIANMVRGEDGEWRSLHNPALFQNKMLVGQIYRNELARRLVNLGYEVERTSQQGLFEVTAVPAEVRDAFSTRRKDILAQLRAWGRSDAVAAANAALHTRRSKQSAATGPLVEAWRSIVDQLGYDLGQMSPREKAVDTVEAAPQELDVAPIPAQEEAPRRGLAGITARMAALVSEWRGKITGAVPEVATPAKPDPLALAGGIRAGNVTDAALFAVADISERSSSFELATLTARVLNAELGSFSVAEVEGAVAALVKHGVLLPATEAAGGSGPRFTTANAVALERDTAKLVEAGRGAAGGLGNVRAVGRAIAGAGLPEDTRAAVELVHGSKDRFVAAEGWSGDAGAKLVEAIGMVSAAAQHRMLVLAPQSVGARRHEGAGHDARTVSGFLAKYAGVAADRQTARGLREMRRDVRDTVLVVDQAGRLSAQQMHDLTKVANALEIARVVFAGTEHHLHGFQAGAPFSQVLRGGVQVAHAEESRVTAVGATKDAVTASIGGEVAAAFRALGNDRVIEVKPELEGVRREDIGATVRAALATRAVEAWLALPEGQRLTTALVAPSNAAQAVTTQVLRTALKALGTVTGPEVSVETLRTTGLSKVATRRASSFQPGNVVAFQRDLPQLGIARGDMLTVQAVDAAANTVQLTDAGGRQVEWDPDAAATRRGEAAQVYRPENIAIAAGDKIRWTAADRANGIQAGVAGVVQELAEKGARVRLEDGREITVDHAGGAMRHVAYDHVKTTFSAEGGASAKQAIVVLNSRDRALNSTRAFAVSMGLHSEDVQLVVDDRNAVVRSLLARSGERETALDSQAGEAAAPMSAAQGLPTVIQYAVAHVAEREAVFSHYDLMDASMQAGFGVTDLAQIEQGIQDAVKAGLLIAAGRPQHDQKTAAGRMATANDKGGWYTTPEALQAEKAVLDLMREGRGAVTPIRTDEQVTTLIQGSRLNEEQAGAVRFVLTSRDRVIGIQGLAGVGKTHMTKAVVLGLVKDVTSTLNDIGYRPIGLAPSTAAVKELSEGAGIDAQTLQSFLIEFGHVARGDVSPQQLDGLRDEFRNTVLIIDESSMQSNQQMAQVLRVASIVGARTMLLGDVKQLRSVEAGRPFDLLQRAGMPTFTMTNIMRQTKAEMRAAVYAAADGDVDKALAFLGKQRIMEVEGSNGKNATRVDLAHRVAEDWLSLPAEQRETGKTMVIAPARATRDKINDLIHDGLTAKGEIGAEQIVLPVLRNRSYTGAQTTLPASYHAGDVVRFISGLSGAGIAKGQYVTVASVDQTRGTVTLAAGDKRVDWRPGDANHKAKVTVYQALTRRVGAAEQIRWTDTSKTDGVINGHAATVLGHSESHVQILLSNGKVRDFAHDNPILKHFEYDYARTIYASQGGTRPLVLAAISVADRMLANMQTLYVALSRNKIDAALYVDDEKGVRSLIQKQSGMASSALESVGYRLKGGDKILDPWINQLQGGLAPGVSIGGKGLSGGAASGMGPVTPATPAIDLGL